MPMDVYQALSVIGFDGPDSLSPKARIREELARLKAVRKPHHPILVDRIEELAELETTATEKGGFQRRYEMLREIFINQLIGVDHAALTERKLMRTIIAPLAEAGLSRAEVVEIAPFLMQFAAELKAGRIVTEQPKLTASQKSSSALNPGLDGTDWNSPRAEIAQGISELESLPSRSEWQKERLVCLRRMLPTATEKGGFQP